MDLSIIIVNYNVKEFIQNLIHSISEAGSNLSYEIIIVDNASTDGSVEFLRERFPNIKLIANEKNLGFSKANNIGLNNSSGDYLLFLNPDTIVREDTFSSLIQFFKEHPEAGLVGCKILNPDGTLQLACRRSFPGPWVSFCKVTSLSHIFPKSRLFAKYNLTYLDENDTYEVDAISGSFMMFTREVYNKIGGLDEQFFMYGEDLDFCYRIQKAGYKVYYVHSTQIIHYKGESTKRSSLDETKIFYDAMHLFVRKHLSGSLILEVILQTAIFFRKTAAFLGKRKLAILPLLFDFILFELSLFAAYLIYTGLKPSWHGIPEYGYPVVFIIPALIHIITASAAGVYRRNSFSVLRNLGAIVLGFLLLTSLTFFFKEFAYSRGVILITYSFLFFILSFWRIIAKLIFRIGLSREEYSNKKTLIVGTPEQSRVISEKLKGDHLHLREIIGFIGLSFKDSDESSPLTFLGSIENAQKVISEYNIDEVIFASGDLSYNQMMSVVSKCQNENAEFKLIGNDSDFIVGKSSVSILNENPLIDLNYNMSSPSKRFIKSLFDIGLSILVLIFIYPFIYLSILLFNKRTEFKNFIMKIPSVLKREFSFVGPERKEVIDALYLGKKGLTGLWYIEGRNGNESGKLDIYYAKNQNIWFDLEIIGRTLIKMWEKK